MRFKDKTYGLNLLVHFWLQIELQLSCNYNILVFKVIRSKDKAPFFLMSKKNLNPLNGLFNSLKIIKSGTNLRKLWAPKVDRVKNSKKKNVECYKGWFLNTQKIPYMLFCCY